MSTDQSSPQAIVLLSGGQDSTTCLFQAIEDFGRENVHALTISYGQRHAIEIDAARKIAQDADVPWDHVELPGVLIGSSPLVSDNEVGQYDSADELPGGVEPTFVPGRNALFLVIAANRAEAVGATTIYTGVCEEDFGGYFDCRQAFIEAMAIALSEAVRGDSTSIWIETPLMRLTKAETVFLAQKLDGCMDALAHSHTCYNGSYPPCGSCHACILRRRGFDQAQVVDPLDRRAMAEHA